MRMYKRNFSFLLIAILSISTLLFSPATEASASEVLIPEKLKVEYGDFLKVPGYEDYGNVGGYSIDVGKRTGTLVLRIENANNNKAWEQWRDQASKFNAVPMVLVSDPNKPDEYINGKINPALIMMLERNPYYPSRDMGVNIQPINNTFLIGATGYIDKVYNKTGKYYLSGGLQVRDEKGKIIKGAQPFNIQAYFYPNVNVKEQVYKGIKQGGYFPLVSPVKWGKTELRQGQIGKVTVNKPINLWKREGNKIVFARVLQPGEQFRVYKYYEDFGGQYGVGGDHYITKMPSHITYETPAKIKLKLLEIINGK